MADETPAETLRRAAEALNVAAVGAKNSAAGRWYVRTPGGGYPQSIADNASAVLVADAFEGPQHPQTTAPFIASMDPTFAFKLATLLEAIANLTVLREDYGDVGPSPIEVAAYGAALAYLREVGA